MLNDQAKTEYKKFQAITGGPSGISEDELCTKLAELIDEYLWKTRMCGNLLGKVLDYIHKEYLFLSTKPFTENDPNEDLSFYLLKDWLDGPKYYCEAYEDYQSVKVAYIC